MAFIQIISPDFLIIDLKISNWEQQCDGFVFKTLDLKTIHAKLKDNMPELGRGFPQMELCGCLETEGNIGA